MLEGGYEDGWHLFIKMSLEKKGSFSFLFALHKKKQKLNIETSIKNHEKQIYLRLVPNFEMLYVP